MDIVEGICCLFAKDAGVKCWVCLAMLMLHSWNS